MINKFVQIIRWKNTNKIILCLLVFFPITEFIALEPVLVLRFAKLSASPFPVCVLRKFIYIYSFCPELCLCVCVFVRANLTFFFVFCLFLGPTVLLLDTRMLPGNCFLLILSYLNTKDVPLGRFTATGTGH